MPAGAADGGNSKVKLLAQAATGSGTPGTVFSGAGADGVDAVAGLSGADDDDAGEIVASLASVSLTKSATVADPFGGTQPVPGAIITYTIAAAVTGSGSATGLRVSDTFPTSTTYVANSLTLDGSALTDGTDSDAGEASADSHRRRPRRPGSRHNAHSFVPSYDRKLRNNKMFKRLILVISISFAAFLALPAHAEEIQLKGDVKVVRTIEEGGVSREELLPPDRVVPGDRLVFTTHFHNTSAEPAKDFVVTNPLPAAVMLAKDGDFDVSVDGGQTFAPLRSADGGRRGGNAARSSSRRRHAYSMDDPPHRTRGTRGNQLLRRGSLANRELERRHRLAGGSEYQRARRWDQIS